jgi:hypothetical protein
MSFAGHLPTKHFDLAEWQAMPVWVPEAMGEIAPVGFSRFRHPISGKPIVVFSSFDAPGYAVSPVVRVKMGRRVVGSPLTSQTERPRCLLCGSRGMQSYCGRTNCPTARRKVVPIGNFEDYRVVYAKNSTVDWR